MGTQNLQAYLSVRDGLAAMDFYMRAFDASPVGPRLTGPTGEIVHMELLIAGCRMLLAQSNPDFGNVCPRDLGGTPVRLNLEVDDVDAAVQKAVDTGANLVIPVSDQFYGYRSGRIEDPFGHQWILSQKIEDVSPEEMQNRLNAMFAGEGE